MACKEPGFCNCLNGCAPFKKTTFSLNCGFGFLVNPNLGAYWTSRIIKSEISWAKEKLAFEAGKGYEGKWKDHVIDGKKAGVLGMYGLLGTYWQDFKKGYEKGITSQMLQEKTQACDVAKCLAYCGS